ncbi:MAG: hypothetical protein BGO22_11635 [Hydrogenophaga sp. 70-12]|nr:MAG: hypothetical protein BGO22_11635 [Hydrogenophaga sp. 70-12]
MGLLPSGASLISLRRLLHGACSQDCVPSPQLGVVVLLDVAWGPPSQPDRKSNSLLADSVRSAGWILRAA